MNFCKKTILSKHHLIKSNAPLIAEVKVYLMKFFLLFWFCLSLPLAQAQSSNQSSIEFTGFGTLGYAQTDKYSDRVLRRNVSQNGEELADNGFLIDSRLGFQINAEINTNWDFVGQIVLKEQFSQGIDEYIQALFVRYQSSNEWQLNLGRQPFDLFLLSDHTNVGYSFDWVRPPSQFYGHLPYDSFDGIKLSRFWDTLDHSWQLGLSIGNLDEEYDAISFAPQEGNYILGENILEATPIYNIELRWDTGDWSFRFNHADLNFTQHLQDFGESQLVIDFLGVEGLALLEGVEVDNTLVYTAIGVSWNPGNFKLQLEYSDTKEDTLTFGGKRGYLHFAYRFDSWLPFITYGFVSDDEQVQYEPPPVSTPQEAFLVELIRQGAEQISTNQRNNEYSITAGLRWDFTNNQALKFQCDRFYFDANSGSLNGRVDAIYPNDETRTWCSASYEWVF